MAIPKNVLVTGGTGFIGSHTVIKLIESGYDVTILDNLSNSNLDVLNKIFLITSIAPSFVSGDVRDKLLLRDIFSKNDFEAVIHFAGLKSVSDSVSNPLEYFDNNVGGSVVLLQEMKFSKVRKLIFSSSATVYGRASCMPISEDYVLSPTNPYGRSKLIVENILEDLYESDPSWKIGILRYFNPVGAHCSGLIGENYLGAPSNLFPIIGQVIQGLRDRLYVYGGDYTTSDGTGVRDYIHVDDLANGHISALSKFEDHSGLLKINLGTGCGYSVLEVINTYQNVSGTKVPYEIVGRRPGDVAECYANPAKARELLDWVAVHDINSMCADAYRWHVNMKKSRIT